MLFVYRRYDDDLDEVEEEDHFEDVDDLEVSAARKMRFAVCIVRVRLMILIVRTCSMETLAGAMALCSWARHFTVTALCLSSLRCTNGYW